MPKDNFGKQYDIASSGTNNQVCPPDARCIHLSQIILTWHDIQGNRYDSRDYGSSAPNQNSYHYSNSKFLLYSWPILTVEYWLYSFCIEDGSYYYSNPNVGVDTICICPFLSASADVPYLRAPRIIMMGRGMLLILPQAPSLAVRQRSKVYFGGKIEDTGPGLL